MDRNLLGVTVYQDGMQLDMLFPVFRLFYPPMFLPWKEVVAAARVPQLMFDCVRLTFAECPDDPITILCTLEDRVFNVVGPVWSYVPHSLEAESTIASKPTARAGP